MPEPQPQFPQQPDALHIGAADEESLAYEATPESAKIDIDEVRRAQATMRRWIELIESDGRYPLAAYRFLQEGLEATVADVHGDATASQPHEGSGDDPRHVDGPALCQGLREHALRSYGSLAREVLRRWGISNTRDFGEMVFFLVEHDFLQKTADDRLSDFNDVFDFNSLDNYSIDLSSVTIEDRTTHLSMVN